jgi:hypothetical protein
MPILGFGVFQIEDPAECVRRGGAAEKIGSESPRRHVTYITSPI